MELKKLTKENLGARTKKGLATVSFTRRGLVILSQCSLKKLGIDNNSLVDVFEGDTRSEFLISRGTTYKLRRNGPGGAVFNCAALSALVIDRSWMVSGRPSVEDPPDKFSFVICDKPVDDEENSHIFALLRKKT